MRLDQWCVGVGGLSRLRVIVTSAEIDIIDRRAYGDRHQSGQPSADSPVHSVCHRCEKCFRSSGTRIDGRSLQTDSTRIMRDQKEHADTEGEVQMGTTRADVDAITQKHGNSVTMLRLLRDGVLSIVDEDRELAMRKVYRETLKRNLRPHQQVEQAQTGKYDRRKVVGCSHTIKADEASGSDP